MDQKRPPFEPGGPNPAANKSRTEVTDLSPLADLTKLQTVSLAYCDVKDIGVLANFPNLNEVDVSNTLVTDFTPFLKCEQEIAIICIGIPDSVTEKVDGANNITVIKEEKLIQ